jgi:hypothetical protein
MKHATKSRNGRFIVNDLRAKRDSCGAFSLTFKPTGKLTGKERKLLEDNLKKSFHHWWDCWVSPLVDEVEYRLVKTKDKLK